MPLGAWLTADGITYVPQSIFAYNLQQGLLGLTLLRSPIYGDLRICKLDETADYDIIDRGITEGSLRVCFEGDPWEAAEHFCNSPTVIIESNHPGILPPQDSCLQLSDEGVRLMALKECEDDGCPIIRLAETQGAARPLTFTFRAQTYTAPFTPYEIKTLKLRPDEAEEVNMLEF